eukprot:911634-Pleurochrysis_carterae.AAC.1
MQGVRTTSRRYFDCASFSRRNLSSIQGVAISGHPSARSQRSITEKNRSIASCEWSGGRRAHIISSNTPR